MGWFVPMFGLAAMIYGIMFAVNGYMSERAALAETSTTTTVATLAVPPPTATPPPPVPPPTAAAARPTQPRVTPAPIKQIPATPTPKTGQRSTPNPAPAAPTGTPPSRVVFTESGSTRPAAGAETQVGINLVWTTAGKFTVTDTYTVQVSVSHGPGAYSNGGIRGQMAGGSFNLLSATCSPSGSVTKTVSGTVTTSVSGTIQCVGIPEGGVLTWTVTILD